VSIARQIIDTEIKPLTNQYQPVELDYITIDSICGHNLYLRMNNQYVLYRSAQTPFTMQDKERLQQSKNKFIFIYCESEGELRRFYEQNLATIVDSTRIPVRKKAEVLYQCARGITQEIFQNPDNKEVISRSKTVVDNTIRLLSSSSDAFLQMISLSTHDYYTYTHCVNVMAFSVGLLSALGVKNMALLKEVGMGALLHDIGKAKVPLSILNKPAPLTDDEWSIMKKHPSLGFEMLSDSRTPDAVKTIVVQHHEKVNGIGYPSGLKGESISLISQVVSLCDAYDAMTTTRVYKKAMSPFQAFKLISEQMRGQFNPNLIIKLIEILNLKDRAR
jgi:putative nucleotidyltransferase with HDIG domain